MLWLFGLVASLAWGAGAFGSPYPWAYTPLLIASTTLGLTGLWLGRRSSGPSAPLLAGFTFIAVAVAAQLVPLSMNLVAALSPQGAVILGQLNPLASLVRSPSYSLSLDPSRTQLGLAFFGGFALLCAVVFHRACQPCGVDRVCHPGDGAVVRPDVKPIATTCSWPLKAGCCSASPLS